MTNKLEVWKFGGASLADAAAIQRAAKLIAAHDGPLVVVASALAGITDLLISGARSPDKHAHKLRASVVPPAPSPGRKSSATAREAAAGLAGTHR